MDDLQEDLTLTFRNPIELGGVQYAEVQLSEPDGGQLVEAGKAMTAMEQLVALISINGKMPKAAVLKIKQRDLEVAANFFARFSDGPPPASQTSETPSLT